MEDKVERVPTTTLLIACYRAAVPITTADRSGFRSRTMRCRMTLPAFCGKDFRECTSTCHDTLLRFAGDDERTPVARRTLNSSARVRIAISNTQPIFRQ